MPPRQSEFPIPAGERLKKHILESYYNRGRPACPPSVVRERLDAFAKQISTRDPNQRGWIDPLRTAGFYAVMLNVTNRASRMDYPLNENDFKTPNRGQIAGQRSGATNRILSDWKIPYRFGTESGGTNRASIGHLDKYIPLLNELYAAGGVDHLAAIIFWLKGARQYFQASPIELLFDPKQSLRTFIDKAIAEVRNRERNVAGAKLTGLFMQHMVGAKLDLILGKGKIQHHSATQADLQYARSGDFEVEEAVLHISSSPTERLIDKCRANLDNFKRPVIVTLAGKTEAAVVLAENAELSHRIEIIDFETLMVTNLLERTFARSGPKEVTVRELLDAYSKLVETHDPVAGIRVTIRSP